MARAWGMRVRGYFPQRSCGKWVYRSRRHAEETRKRLAATDGLDLWVYRCPDCGHYHLTSMERREAATLPG